MAGYGDVLVSGRGHRVTRIIATPSSKDISDNNGPKEGTRDMTARQPKGFRVGQVRFDFDRGFVTW